MAGRLPPARSIRQRSPPHAAPVSEGEEEGRREDQRLGDDVSEAGVLDGPGRAPVERDENSQVGPQVKPLWMAGIDDQGMGGKIGQPGAAGAVETLPGRAAVDAFPYMSAAEGRVGRVDDERVHRIEDERGDEAIPRIDRRPQWSRAGGRVAAHDEALAGAGEN